MAQERDTDFDSANKALIGRWTREKERAEEMAKHMKESIEEAMTKMLKNKQVKSNVAVDLKEATKNKFDKDKVFDGFQVTGDADAEIADWIANRGKRESDDD